MKINNCKQCGVCCKLFYINLNEDEYLSGKFKTIFDDNDKIHNFDKACQCGANFLAKKEDGICIYLEDSKCAIHTMRPQVCHEFFCDSDDPKFANMQEVLSEYKVSK